MDCTVSSSDIDGGRIARWGGSAEDYSAFRPDPPQSLYDRLRALGVGLPGQSVLDLGTGTGALALKFAQLGCRVVGTDVDPDQIEAAKERRDRMGLDIKFYQSAAESTPEGDHTFDVVTANQCWSYFDRKRAIPEVKRLLRPGGQLVISSFTYLPLKSPIARSSEAIVKRFNPGWTSADWDGVTPPSLRWTPDFGVQGAMFVYDEMVQFTQAAWRGRMRALRAIGPTLAPAQVAAFDEEHAALLENEAPAVFDIPHRISAYILRQTL